MPKFKLPQTYRVKSGDNWFNVAQRLRINAADLAQSNKNIVKLLPGQTIKAPGKKKPAQAVTYPENVKGSYAWQTRNARQVPRSPVAPVPRQRPSEMGGVTAPAAPAQVPAFTTPVNMPGSYAWQAQQASNRYQQQQKQQQAVAGRTAKETVPGQVHTTASKAYQREQGFIGQRSLGATYTNLAQVEINLSRGNLPLIISPETVERLGLDREMFKSMGYIENENGDLIRPNYLPAPIEEGPAVPQAKGRSYAGYEYPEYPSYTRENQGYFNVPQAANVGGATPTRNRSRLQEIGQLSWRI